MGTEETDSLFAEFFDCGTKMLSINLDDGVCYKYGEDE